MRVQVGPNDFITFQEQGDTLSCFISTDQEWRIEKARETLSQNGVSSAHIKLMPRYGNGSLAGQRMVVSLRAPKFKSANPAAPPQVPEELRFHKQTKKEAAAKAAPVDAAA